MYSIAIDGPSGAGKSYLAGELAKRLGYIHVDTGALYRTVGLAAYRRGIAPADTAAVVRMLAEITVTLSYTEGRQVVRLDGEAVGGQIRIPEISMYASAVSAIPEVREFLFGTQRDFAAAENVIMDGRDIGTVILPDADVKIFLIASDRVRARRRCLELREKGIETTEEAVLADMAVRDKNDSTRTIAPAVPADDAVILDSSELDPGQVVGAALEIIKKKIPV